MALRARCSEHSGLKDTAWSRLLALRPGSLHPRGRTLLRSVYYHPLLHPSHARRRGTSPVLPDDVLCAPQNMAQAPLTPGCVSIWQRAVLAVKSLYSDRAVGIAVIDADRGLLWTCSHVAPAVGQMRQIGMAWKSSAFNPQAQNIGQAKRSTLCLANVSENVLFTTCP